MVSFNIAITTEPTDREAYCQLRESHASNQRQQIRGIIVITAREKFSYALSTACGPLLRYVCHGITDIEGNFIIILYFISLRGLSISMAISYI